MPRLKWNINVVLPIILAIVFPGLSIYSNTIIDELSKTDIFFVWVITSFVLYFFWHLLWRIWDFESRIKKYSGFTLVSVMALFTPIILYKLGSRELDNDLILRGSIRSILAIIIFLTIQYALKVQMRISKLLLEKEQLQTENYKVQLKALRNKIDPHFLFNSLNTLSAMVKRDHENSEKFIHNLSDFYRQTLKYNENTSITLSDELKVLDAFLFLMKSRNEHAFNINISVSDEAKQKHLPSFALQVVLENCFKHNSMTSKNPLNIEISTTSNNYVTVKNNIQSKIGTQEKSGHGLVLLQKRYNLSKIPDGIKFKKTTDHFIVQLKLI